MIGEPAHQEETYSTYSAFSAFSFEQTGQEDVKNSPAGSLAGSPADLLIDGRNCRRSKEQLSSGAKGVTSAYFAAFEAPAEPCHPLLGRAMGKGVRADVSLRHLLEPIIAHSGRGLQARLHISLVDDLPVGGRMSPHTGKAVCLQFHGYGKLIARLRVLLLNVADFALDAQHVLHVMPDFVRHYICLGEFARGAVAT
jgi:hypothetical protein